MKVTIEFDLPDQSTPSPELTLMTALGNVGTRIYQGEASGQVTARDCLLKGEADALLGSFEVERKPRPQWCPVCKTDHLDVGEQTDAGLITRACPNLPTDDSRYFGSPLYTGDRGRA